MFYIAYYGTSGNGYVDYNEDSCNSIDNAMTFETKEEAEKYREELQKEWASELRVEEYIED